MVDTLVCPLGQIPNDMLLIDERLTIVESGDNQWRQYAIEPSDEACQWTLPVGSNPWSAAFDARTRSLAISEWGTNSILLINPSRGRMRRLDSAHRRSEFNASTIDFEAGIANRLFDSCFAYAAQHDCSPGFNVTVTSSAPSNSESFVVNRRVHPLQSRY